MQPNFTLKKFGSFLRLTPVFLVLCCLFAGKINAQTISTAGGTNYLGNLSINNTNPLNVSFVIQNTTGSAVALTDVSTHMAPFGAISAAGDASVTKLYVSSTSLSGVYDYSTPAWTQIASGNAVVPAALAFVPVITGINYIIPAGAQLRFVLELSKGLRISSNLAGDPMPTPNVFSSGGINLQLGNFQIAAQNVGFGGVAPTAPAGNTPVFFGGTVTLVSTLPCAGTPAVGNTLSTANPVCPGINFTLSTQTPSASGLSYQWQSAPAAAGPWTNVGTNATLTTNQTVATWYRATVTCGANSATSTPLQVNMAPITACYCTPTYSNGCAFGDFISNVTVGTLNNNSACSTPPFTYYNAVPAPVLVQTGTYPVSVTVGPDGFGQYVRVWADWNQDADFNDPGEAVGVSGNVGANGTAIINMTIPATATLGNTRMRVRGGDDAAPTAAQSCGASGSTFGEAEDYNINIQPCVQGVFTTNPSSTSIQCSGNASFTVAATGSALTFQWQYRVNASSPWLTVPNAAPYSGVTTTTLTLTNASQTLNGYQYRAVMQGPCTAVDFSGIATLTVTPLIATVSPTAATICTGSIQQLTLTNASSPTTVSFNNTTPLAIPDANATGVQSTLPVAGIPAGAIVSNISVRFNIPAHTYVGDLSVNLIAPNNVVMNLVGELDNGTGSNSSDGFVNTTFSSTSVALISGAPAPRTGTYAAERRTGFGPTGFQQTAAGTNWANLLTTLNGNWKLAIADPWAGDNGTLTDWTITITYGAPAAGVWTSSPAAPNTMFTDPAATIPYVAGTPLNSIYVKPTVNTNYTVVYTTATPCVSNPTTIPVTVVNPVVLTSSPANRSVCVGGSTTFTVAATGGPLTYQWQVSTDGGLTYTNIAGATSASYTLSPVTAAQNNNRYRAIITAAPCAGSTTSTAAILTVNALPVVTISSPDLSLTPGQTTTITATSSPAAATANSWSWTLDGSAISGTTNTQVVGVDGFGDYQARVTDVNGCVGFSNTLTIGAEASDRLWIYPNPSSGAFQVRLYYGSSVTEQRRVSIFNSGGQLVGYKEFTLDQVLSPYLRMDFDLSNLGAGTYVVKVHNTYTNKVVSGLVVIQH